MSKKLLLKTWERSFADVVKDENWNENEEGVPGRPVIKPKFCIFKYKKLDSPRQTTLSVKRTPVKKIHKKKVHDIQSDFEQEMEEIIEILSSPEKSPFKDSAVVEVSSDSSPCMKRARRQIKMECEEDSTHAGTQLQSSDDSDYLPSLDELTSAPLDHEPVASNSENHFSAHPGKCFSNIYQAFTTVNRGLNADEILQVLQQPDDYDVCISTPQYVQQPAGFLINTNFLKDKKDIRADGNGVWCVKNKPKRNYIIDESGKAHIAKQENNTNDIHQIIRSYSSHKETPSFRRLIIEKSGSPFVILQFYFIGDIVPVDIKPHGNSKRKNAQPYRRVASSTMKQMLDLSRNKNMSAKGIMKDVVEENGGMENIQASCLPRNPQQIRNLKRKLQEDKADEIAELLHVHDTQLESDIFIRKVSIRPDFIVVLATDHQISDLQRFCTERPFSILGVDPTFHFGDFDVTVTTYKHPMLEETTSGKCMLNNSPVFVGPICIHKKKDTQTYYNFMSTLISKNDKLKKLKAVGTDGEISLSNALLMAFENAVHLRCSNHVSRNIKNKLKDIGVSKQNKTNIISDIFGKSDDVSVRISGLVDCFTHAEFEQKLQQLHEKWESLAPGFWAWFRRNQSETFKHNMIQSVRLEAGLPGPQMYTTNDNESINSALQRVCGRNLPITTFIREIKDFIKAQENQLLLAIVEEGSYRLRHEYHNFEVPLSTWATLSSADRKKHIAKVHRCAIVESDRTSDDVTQVPLPTQMLDSTLLSVNVESCGITDTSSCILKDMWEKAEKLIQMKFSICEIPNLPNSRRVCSLSNPKTCHYVEYCSETGKASCDCYLNKLHKICHHVIAVSEELEMLQLFVEWRRNKNTNYSLTSAVNAKLPKTAGRKPNERQNWSKNKKKVQISSSCTVLDPLPAEVDDFYVFRFIQKTKIMVCYGCGQKFRSNLSEIPSAPADLVLAKKEYRKYVNNYGQLKMAIKKEFVHYHIRSECVKKIDPSFDPQKIVVTGNIKSELKKEHLDVIRLCLGLFI